MSMERYRKFKEIGAFGVFGVLGVFGFVEVDSRSIVGDQTQRGSVTRKMAGVGDLALYTEPGLHSELQGARNTA
jgi:hypothetical protein